VEIGYVPRCLTCLETVINADTNWAWSKASTLIGHNVITIGHDTDFAGNDNVINDTVIHGFYQNNHAGPHYSTA